MTVDVLDRATRNKSLVLSYHDELWGQGDRTAIDRYWHPDAKVHMTDFEGTAVDVVRADAARYFGAFKEVETRIQHLVAESDLVALHWTTSGLHVAPYGDVAATQKRVTMAGIDVLRIAEDRIAECWSMWDGLSVYEQLGVLSIASTVEEVK